MKTFYSLEAWSCLVVSSYFFLKKIFESFSRFIRRGQISLFIQSLQKIIAAIEGAEQKSTLVHFAFFCENAKNIIF